MTYVYPTFSESTVTLFYGSNKPRRGTVTITRMDSCSTSSRLTVSYEDGGPDVAISGDELAFVALLNVGYS